MRTLSKVVIGILFYGFYITMACIPQWKYKYIGEVVSLSEVRKFNILQGSTGYYVMYKFDYKDKYGNIRPSSFIKSFHPDISAISSERGFITYPDSWVEKQLLEKGKVYIPGWRTLYILIFAFYTMFALICLTITVARIYCFINGRSPHRCYKYNCEISGLCPFNSNTLDKDIEDFNNTDFSGLKRFFGYDENSSCQNDKDLS